MNFSLESFKPIFIIPVNHQNITNKINSNNYNVYYQMLDNNQLTKTHKANIYNMYKESYKNIGISYNEKDYEKMFEYYPYGIYIYENSEIRGVILYWKNKYGNKISLVFGSNNDNAKNYIFPVVYLLLTNEQGWYVELSEGFELLCENIIK